MALLSPFVVAVWPPFDSPIDDSYPYFWQHEQVMAMLERLGIHAVDLRPLYDGIELRRLVVTPFTDAHPNELAHRIAADFLADYVRHCLSVEVKYLSIMHSLVVVFVLRLITIAAKEGSTKIICRIPSYSTGSFQII